MVNVSEINKAVADKVDSSLHHTSTASVNINNCNVFGVDLFKRMASLRQSFMFASGNFAGAKIPILRDINFSCKAGERVGLIGHNGCGKSSMLKLIAGIYPPDSGTVHVNGEITALIEMGMGIEPELTGRQNIKVLMLYNNMLDKYNKELEQKVIDFSELGEKIDQPIKNYSSGMVARLVFSSSIFQEPDILILDEVFATGDKSFVKKSFEIMQDKVSKVPITIMVSHQEEIIRENCNRALLLDSGRIIADGTVDEIYRQYEG